MNYITFQTIVVLACLTAGCGKQGVVPSVDAPSTDNNAPVAAPLSQAQEPVVTSDGVDATLMVYSKSVTRTPGASETPRTAITSTANCTVYKAQTYCWDSALPTMTKHADGTAFLYYSYFNYSSSSAFGIAAVIPREFSANTQATQMAAGAVAAVLSSGTASSFDCVDTDGVVDCGNFVIDTTQGAL